MHGWFSFPCYHPIDTTSGQIDQLIELLHRGFKPTSIIDFPW